MALLAILASCGLPPLQPGPGVWKEVNHRKGKMLGREFGIVRVLVEEPQFIKNAVVVRLWLVNNGNNPIQFDTAEMFLVEPGGRERKNDAKSEKRDLSGVGDEMLAGEFAPENFERCRLEGFKIRFSIAAYNPILGKPIPLEFHFSRD